MVVSGFAHAPVTKGVMLITSVGSVGAALLQLQPYTHVQLVPHLLVHHQWYRLAVQHVAFVNSSELFLALLLLYQAARQVERTLGSHKYASFLLVTVALYTLAQLALLSTLHLVLTGVNRAPAGPWAIVFATVYQHSRLVPDRWTVQIGRSVQIGNNTISVYSLAVVLALSQSSRTLFTVLLATLCAAYSAKQSYRIPPRVFRLLSLLLQPWLGSTKLPTRSWRAEPPQRRPLAARQARLAQHTEQAQSRLAQGSLAVPRLAAYLRRRAPAAPPQQPAPPPPPPPLLPV